MRICAIALLWLAALTSSAQSKDVLALAEAIERLNQAMIDANQIALQELTSPQLSYGHSSGLVEDKDTFIAAIVGGQSGFRAIDLTDQSVIMDKHVAIVRHKFVAQTNNRDQPPGQVSLAVMQVWRKENGKWHLLARQATRI